VLNEGPTIYKISPFPVIMGVELRDYVDVNFDSRFSFGCLRCGECCEMPPLILPGELGSISKKMGMGKQQFYKSKCLPFPYNGMLMFKQANGKCTFYVPGKEGKCDIYEYRPMECKTTPIGGRAIFTCTMDDLNHPERIVLTSCPGVGSGEEILVSDFIDQDSVIGHYTPYYEHCREFISLMGGTEKLASLIQQEALLEPENLGKIVPFIEGKYGIKL
jgi:hypothetical protein